MTTSRGGRRRWLVALCGVALGVATSGCSNYLARSGVNGVSGVYGPGTRAEVRAAFGEADETGTCPDGRPVERRSIRQQVTMICQQPAGFAAELGCSGLLGAYQGSLGLVDVVVFPVMAYRSEQAKLHYAFVYGEDDLVLYRYNLAAAPPQRFGEAVNWYPLFSQLEESESGCPSWGACLSASTEEALRRAACVGYPLAPEVEETFQQLHAIAADVDAHRLPKDEALAELKWCLRTAPPSCLPPPPSRSAPTPASGHSQGE